MTEIIADSLKHRWSTFIQTGHDRDGRLKSPPQRIAAKPESLVTVIRRALNESSRLECEKCTAVYYHADPNDTYAGSLIDGQLHDIIAASSKRAITINLA